MLSQVRRCIVGHPPVVLHVKVLDGLWVDHAVVSLLPGDVIATGTSAGVALFAEGQPYLQEGQKVRVEIEQIGYIENLVALEKDPSFIR